MRHRTASRWIVSALIAACLSVTATGCAIVSTIADTPYPPFTRLAVGAFVAAVGFAVADYGSAKKRAERAHRREVREWLLTFHGIPLAERTGHTPAPSNSLVVGIGAVAAMILLTAFGWV